MALLWFHAFKRTETPEVLAVIRYGPVVAPMMTETKQLELHLSISPPSIYCYLGRTLETFGDAAIALAPQHVSGGHMSPFDTGGLVRKIAPVCSWTDDDKRAFLAEYSWPAAERMKVLAVYPGITETALRRYLNLTLRPAVAGPHVLWADRKVANIWEDNHDWRAWTWECRWPTNIDVGGSLVAWTCSTAKYADLLRWADAATPDDFAWFDSVLGRYVPGGVGALIRHLESAQAAQ